ncbi:MAG: UDP-N-acetylmuramate dehydrogenase [Ruminococcaceae bacterium]|nr:UDP-N-acetylmuramate dehydrogenase [Oscillospiraceae bacterium]
MTENLTALASLIQEYNNEQINADQKIEIKYSEPMSRHTSFRIGGIADLYLIPQSMSSFVDLCGMVKKTGAKYYILGNGSNVLFADEGYAGAVISTANLCRISVDGNRVEAESGALLNLVCKAVRDHSLTGMEFAYGIPGSVGGAVFMNAGAYNKEIACVLKESTYLDMSDFSVHTITNAEHNFGYRESVYRSNNYLILSAVFELELGNKEVISDTMNDYMNRRISKQPLDYPSAGSIFKRYPGRYTSQMIDECGLKGYQIGGAQVSEKHAGFIINRGGATAEDVLALVDHIKKCVYDKFECKIECEVIQVK